uniref:Uncharacterized protein LOC102808890 n=1 Tax=Saccoglossus kowalevskii TaxID=10224 RepID=A0ABM0LXN5_SACKO|nr:PREDICTED: uncharacterized protein LOC102808890 [Saccoglossus kowalevskii]
MYFIFIKPPGTERRWCGSGADPPGFFFRGQLSTNPFGNSMMARLFGVTLDTNINAFITYDISDEIAALPKRDIIDLIVDILPSIDEMVLLINTFIDNVSEFTQSALREITLELIGFKEDLETIVIGRELFSDLPDILSPVRSRAQKIMYICTDLQQQLADESTRLSTGSVDSLLNYAHQLQSNIERCALLYVENVLKIRKDYTGVGLMFQAKLNIVALGFGSVQIEIVKSNMLGECSRFSDLYGLFKDDKATKGLIQLARSIKYKILTIGHKYLGGVFALAPDTDEFLFRFFGGVNILGVNAEANVFVTNEVIHFEIDGYIWDVCYATIFAQASVFVPWSDQRWTVRGEFGFGTQSLPMRMTDALINAANAFGEKATLRLTQAQDLVTDAQDGVSRAQQWLQDKKEDVDKANNKFDEAVNALDNAVAEIDSLQDDVQSAKDWLREKRLDIDNLCQMRNCHKICIPFIKCHWRRTRFLRIPSPSYYLSGCGIKITDPLCIAANIICAAIRAVAYVALGIAEKAVGVAMIALDAANDAPFKCLPCPPGSYQPGIGSATCLPCPDGYTTYKDSALRIDECNVSLVSDKTTPSQTTVVAIELNDPGSSGDILSVLDITAVSCSVIILLVIGIVIYFVVNRRNKRGVYRPIERRDLSLEMDETNNDPTSQNNLYDSSFGIDELVTEM